MERCGCSIDQDVVGSLYLLEFEDVELGVG